VSSLSTHVLDTSVGRPATGVSIKLLRGGEVLLDGRTDEDGRCPELRAIELTAGRYVLLFGVGAYFRRSAGEEGEAFLEEVPVEFGISAGASHTHVPLLVSPFGYTTYRGS
jgi:5-hydroxyisourate hydrolase